jgi:hypothetical protein
MKVRTIFFSSVVLFTALLRSTQPLMAIETVAASNASETELKSRSKHTLKHNIQLQVTDFFGVPVENTEFWITLDLVKDGDQVTVHLPTINFQIGQCAAIDFDCGPPSPGYVVTASGFLPNCFRPSSLVPVAIVAASDNGLPQTSSFAATPTPPQPGFIVQITNTGSVQILATGSNQNWIDPGPQIVAPCSITYLAREREVICENFQLSEGFIDVNQFTGSVPGDTPANLNIQHNHINDAYDGTVVWAYNANINGEYTDNLLNLFVVVGKEDSKGRVKFGDPIQITDLPVNTITLWSHMKRLLLIHRAISTALLQEPAVLSLLMGEKLGVESMMESIHCRTTVLSITKLLEGRVLPTFLEWQPTTMATFGSALQTTMMVPVMRWSNPICSSALTKGLPGSWLLIPRLCSTLSLLE